MRLAAFLEARRTLTTDAGQQISFLSMEEVEGIFAVTWFHRPRDPHPDNLFSPCGPYLVTDQVEDHHGAEAVIAREIAMVPVAALADSLLADQPAAWTETGE